MVSAEKLPAIIAAKRQTLFGYSAIMTIQKMSLPKCRNLVSNRNKEYPLEILTP
jgi:hypothetical protein